MTFTAWVAVVVAGALGAPARYLIDGYVQHLTVGAFPWGTFAVNISGSFVLGLITGLARYHGLGDLPRAALGPGLCGAFTTFSTFTFGTIRLTEEGAAEEAVKNVGFSLACGLAAAGAGLALASL